MATHSVVSISQQASQPSQLKTPRQRDTRGLKGIRDVLEIEKRIKERMKLKVKLKSGNSSKTKMWYIFKRQFRFITT